MPFVYVLQEFVAVRVQDPRVQNEGSWNSYVDYKIFLHVSIYTKLHKVVVLLTFVGLFVLLLHLSLLLI